VAGVDADGTAEPDRPTLPPPGSGGRRRRWALAVVAAVLVVAAVTVGILVARDTGSPEPAADGPPSTRAPSSTANDSPQGIQPDVTYDVRSAIDTTPELATKLADTAAIFAPLGKDLPLLPSSGVIQLERTPATLRYKAYNQSPNGSCRVFTSRPVTVTGLWGRVVSPPNALMSTTVIRFATVAQASEAFIAFSLEQRPGPSECKGFGPGGVGVADYSELDVHHQDVTLTGLPDGARYNVWVAPAAAGYPYAFAMTGIVQHDRTLVLFVLGTTSNAGPPDPATASAVLGNILARV
jgi:hypothetical protein